MQPRQLPQQMPLTPRGSQQTIHDQPQEGSPNQALQPSGRALRQSLPPFRQRKSVRRRSKEREDSATAQTTHPGEPLQAEHNLYRPARRVLHTPPRFQEDVGSVPISAAGQLSDGAAEAYNPSATLEEPTQPLRMPPSQMTFGQVSNNAARLHNPATPPQPIKQKQHGPPMQTAALRTSKALAAAHQAKHLGVTPPPRASSRFLRGAQRRLSVSIVSDSCGDGPASKGCGNGMADNVISSVTGSDEIRSSIEHNIEGRGPLKGCQHQQHQQRRRRGQQDARLVLDDPPPRSRRKASVPSRAAH
mmetsp:Transcript_19553/g.59132  ORF Transcript_19553/g.59132 Transcript_19553/m.59132 type:complete len:303 (-) Transcript_19553:506-1414(-)